MSNDGRSSREIMNISRVKVSSREPGLSHPQEDRETEGLSTEMLDLHVDLIVVYHPLSRH